LQHFSTLAKNAGLSIVYGACLIEAGVHQASSLKTAEDAVRYRKVFPTVRDKRYSLYRKFFGALIDAE
jgi:hypothetical protein